MAQRDPRARGLAESSGMTYATVRMAAGFGVVLAA
jgi:hypothetical protein